MSRESFIFYGSWVEAVGDLPNEVRLEIYDGIIEYAISGKYPDFKPMAKIAFNFIKNDIDRANQKYEEKIRINRQNGSKGGRPKKPNETQNNPSVFLQTQQKHNKNDNEYDNDILLEKESKGIEFSQSVHEEILPDKPALKDLSKKVAQKKVFHIPSTEQVEDYCNQRQNGISGSEFVNFYQAKGWMIGKNKMKDWQAAVRTWEQTRKQNGQSNNQTGSAALNKGSVQANQVQRRNNQFTVDDFKLPS